ncbi:hypothetical protein DPMN_052485 [Dreissena polymorpha]|uniref:Uncharacterized protein n=1 Tax=Dreissena polymorpha TaxID=45954 RepID=A0A9D4CJS7_DREPO|nr:hypothetical protein DPMN_052485 [Dreissena polymorpha]
MSTDQCIYQFEWRTAAACELGHYIGDNCRVQGNGKKLKEKQLFRWLRRRTSSVP